MQPFIVSYILVKLQDPSSVCLAGDWSLALFRVLLSSAQQSISMHFNARCLNWKNGHHLSFIYIFRIFPCGSIATDGGATKISNIYQLKHMQMDCWDLLWQDMTDISPAKNTDNGYQREACPCLISLEQLCVLIAICIVYTVSWSEKNGENSC